MKSGKRQSIEIGDATTIRSAHNLPVTAEGYTGNVVETIALNQGFQKLGKRLLGFATHHEIDQRIRFQCGDVHRGGLRSTESNNGIRLLALYFARSAQRDRIAAANAAEANEIIV